MAGRGAGRRRALPLSRASAKPHGDAKTIFQSFACFQRGGRMRRRTVLALLACGLSCGAAFVACGCDKGSSGGKKKPVVGVIPKGTTHIFWQSIHAGAKKGGDESGVEIRW